MNRANNPSSSEYWLHSPGFINCILQRDIYSSEIQECVEHWIKCKLILSTGPNSRPIRIKASSPIFWLMPIALVHQHESCPLGFRHHSLHILCYNSQYGNSHWRQTVKILTTFWNFDDAYFQNITNTFKWLISSFPLGRYWCSTWRCHDIKILSTLPLFFF